MQPRQRQALLTQTVYRLLEAIYNEEGIVSANPSNESIIRVLEILIKELEKDDSEVEMMENALRLLFPEFMAVEAERPVVERPVGKAGIFISRAISAGLRYRQRVGAPLVLVICLKYHSGAWFFLNPFWIL